VALGLRRRGQRVLVLEAGTVGSGASGCDLGHTPVGLGCHYAAAIERLGRERAHAVWETRRDNLVRLRESIAELRVPGGYDPGGGFAVAVDRDEAHLLAASEDLLRDDGFSGEFLDHYMLEARFDVRRFGGAYWSAADAAIDTLPFLEALAAAAESAGATICEGSRALAIDTTAAGVTVSLEGASAQAAAVVVAVPLPDLVPFLAGRVRAAHVRGLTVATDPSRRVPSPACADHGGIVWRCRPDHRLSIAGLEDRDHAFLEAFARDHFPGVHGPVLQTWNADVSIPWEERPFLGAIPGGPVISLVGSAGYTLLAAEWAAEYIASGTDPTPAPYRAARPLPG